MKNKQLYYYCGDLSISSPAILKMDKDFNIVDILYFTYQQKLINLPHWTQIDLSHIGKESITKMDKWKRNCFMYKYIEDFIESPICLAVEGSSFASTGAICDINQYTGFIIGAIAKKYDLPVFEYAPKEIKKHAGNGSAGKPQMRKFLKMKFPELDEKLLDFEAEPYNAHRYNPPMEDICDVIWIAKLLEHKIKEGKCEGIE